MKLRQRKRKHNKLYQQQPGVKMLWCFVRAWHRLPAIRPEILSCDSSADEQGMARVHLTYTWITTDSTDRNGVPTDEMPKM